MNEANKLKLEVGKWYRTRGGEKVQVLKLDAAGDQPVIVYNENDLITKHEPSGRYYTDEEDSEKDIISPWPTLPSPGEGWRLLGSHELILHTDESTGNGKVWVACSASYGKTVDERVKHENYLAFRRRLTPIVQWADMPKWAKWVSMDEDGTWYWFTRKPRLGDISWMNNYREDDEEIAIMDVVPSAYSPSFTGSWKDSLVERPEEAQR